MNKFQLTTDRNNKNLYRIQACKSFLAGNNHQVSVGDFGGYVENEDNLSQEGTCWVMDDAQVSGNARVCDDAVISGDAQVCDNAVVSGNAQVCDLACVVDRAKVSDYAKICDMAAAMGHAEIYGCATVGGDALVSDFTKIYEKAVVCGTVAIKDKAHVYGEAKVSDVAFVGGNAQVYDKAEIYGLMAYVAGEAKVFGNATVHGTVSGNAEIFDRIVGDFEKIPASNGSISRERIPTYQDLEQLFRLYDTITIFDTETTGFDPYGDNRIIELAAISLYPKNNEVFCDTMDTFVRLSPGETIPEKITELTGITDQQLQEEGISETEAFMQFQKMQNGKTLLVAHNAQFDLGFLDAMAKRNALVGYLNTFDFLDTLTIFKDRRLFPHKLSDAIAAYQLEDICTNTHRAIDDAAATMTVLCEMNKERPDIDGYINIFGVNPKYGIGKYKIENVIYLLQPYRNGMDMADPENTLAKIAYEDISRGESR